MDNIMINNHFNAFDELNSSFNIIIMTERRGRKTNTYVFGWDIEKSELKEHLKTLKKKHGCNGSVKVKDYNGNEQECLQLQGEWSLQVKEYLMANNVSENEIQIK